MSWWFILLCFPLLCTAQRRLEQFNIDRNGISVSGLSSGACMASQFQVIHSGLICGAAIFAGAPYGCADVHGITTCMSEPSRIDIRQLLSNMRSKASSGDIDPVSNLSRDRVFVFNGLRDDVVRNGVGHKTRDFYRQVPVSSVVAKLDLNAGHGFPTVDKGVACGSTGGNYINRCSYNGAFQALNQIYGNLRQPTTAGGQLYLFDQAEFFLVSLPSASAMDTAGYIYMPSGCASKANRCRLHIAFHGCQQGRQAVGTAFVSQAGYNEVGEANNIIILYPQAIATAIPINPAGCWDWWGYTLLYDTKSGPQIIAIKRMIDRLTRGV